MLSDADLRNFDPRSPEFVENPYPIYARMRQVDPVLYIPSVGMWWVTRYDECARILRDRQFGKKMPDDMPTASGPSGDPPGGPPIPPVPPQYARLLELPPTMMGQDPPDHTRLRSLVSKAFTPRMVEQLRPQIEHITKQLLDRIEDQRESDLVSDLAFPLPATVIAELLGVPSTDQDRFREWSNAIIQGIDAGQPAEVREAGHAAHLALVEYFEDLIAIRRAQPQADLISHMIAAEEQGDRLTTGELLSTCVLLLIAGHETTTNLISSGILALLTHPDQLALLRERPELMPGAIEELLRYESPVQRFGYNVLEDTELGGKRLRRGERVSAVLAAANRDPAVFSDPERLDITRPQNQNPHLAFGRNIHFCLGAPLARLEAQIAFSALLERFPRLELAESEPLWHPNTLLRGLQRLPVRV